jgi:aconitate decarboxylase
MVALLARIVLSQTTAISGQFDAMHVDVSVTLADGSRLMRRCAAPPGSWSRPIAPAFIETKARDLLDGVLNKETACSFWSLVAMPSNALRISDLMRSLL